MNGRQAFNLGKDKNEFKVSLANSPEGNLQGVSNHFSRGNLAFVLQTGTPHSSGLRPSPCPGAVHAP